MAIIKKGGATLPKKKKRKSQIVQDFGLTESIQQQMLSIDYDLLKNTIIAANQEIQKKEIEDQQAHFQKDFLTLPIVEIMKTALTIGIFLTVLVMILMPVYSFSIDSTDIIACISNLVFWIAYYALVFLFIFVAWKNKNLNGKWYEVLSIVLSVIMVLAFVFSFIKYGLLGMPMLFAILSGVMLLIFILGKRALKQEFDRSFLISYFSSIISLVALIISIVALVISQKATS